MKTRRRASKSIRRPLLYHEDFYFKPGEQLRGDDYIERQLFHCIHMGKLLS